MKKIKKIIGILLALVFIVLAGAVIIFRNEIRTLATLKKVDDYGMYQMTYYGDYGLDVFFSRGVIGQGIRGLYYGQADTRNSL